MRYMSLKVISLFASLGRTQSNMLHINFLFFKIKITNQYFNRKAFIVAIQSRKINKLLELNCEKLNPAVTELVGVYIWIYQFNLWVGLYLLCVVLSHHEIVAAREITSIHIVFLLSTLTWFNLIIHLHSCWTTWDYCAIIVQGHWSGNKRFGLRIF